VFASTKYIDPEDIRPTNRVVDRLQREQAIRQQALFDVPTLAALGTDATLQWPMPGNLSVTFRMYTSLSRSIDANDDPEHPLIAARGGTAPPFVEWSLLPTNDAINYRGFLPVFLRVRESLGSLCS
jgi:hypothetical protein